MKQLITTLCMLLACSVFAQKKISEKSVNSKVVEAYFRDNSKHSSKDEWSEYPDKYTVVFKDNEEGFVYTYSYSKDGQWLSRTRPVDSSMLTREVNQDLATRYPDYKISTLLIEISDAGKFYVIDLAKDGAEPMRAYYLMSGVFDHDAKIEKPAAEEKPAKTEKPQKTKKSKKK